MTKSDAIDATPLGESEKERARTADLLRLVPRGRQTLLDVGARDGRISMLLTEHVGHVTALDLEKPQVDHPRITAVAGDATRLQFPDNSFDCVFCAEVLEHIPEVVRAACEIARVARHEVIIGVPYRQDLRVGRTTCGQCGRPNPPWGHVNSFDERRLAELFDRLRLVSTSLIGVSRSATNAIAAELMDWGGNPWGTYNLVRPCIYCGALIERPGRRSLARRLCSAAAARMNRVQRLLTASHANWIHVLFSKDTP